MSITGRFQVVGPQFHLCYLPNLPNITFLSFPSNVKGVGFSGEFSIYIHIEAIILG